MKLTTHVSIGQGVAIVLLAVTLSACAPTLQWIADTTGTDIVSASVAEKARKAAFVAFVAWGGPECADAENACDAGGLQKLILEIGLQPRCEIVDPPLICVKQTVWDKIKAISAKTTQTLNRARPLLVAGDNDVALFMSLPEAVFDAQAEIAIAKVE